MRWHGGRLARRTDLPALPPIRLRRRRAAMGGGYRNRAGGPRQSQAVVDPRRHAEGIREAGGGHPRGGPRDVRSEPLPVSRLAVDALGPLQPAGAPPGAHHRAPLPVPRPHPQAAAGLPVDLGRGARAARRRLRGGGSMRAPGWIRRRGCEGLPSLSDLGTARLAHAGGQPLRRPVRKPVALLPQHRAQDQGRCARPHRDFADERLRLHGLSLRVWRGPGRRLETGPRRTHRTGPVPGGRGRAARQHHDRKSILQPLREPSLRSSRGWRAHAAGVAAGRRGALCGDRAPHPDRSSPEWPS